jgi:hypothetical protein
MPHVAHLLFTNFYKARQKVLFRNPAMLPFKKKVKDLNSLKLHMPNQFLIYKPVQYAAQRINKFLLGATAATKNHHSKKRQRV